MTVDSATRHRNSQFGGDARVDGTPEQDVVVLRVALAVEAIHAVMKGVVDARLAVLPARTGLDVNHLHRRLVPGDPAGLGEAVAEVEVFHVLPVALVEEPYLVQRLAPYQHEGAVDRVHGCLLYTSDAADEEDSVDLG